MTDIEQKALALVLEIERARECPEWAQHPSIKRKQFGMDEALCRAIEQHEAFRQEVSDALLDYFDGHVVHVLTRFIIAKPDPLVEVLKDMGYSKNAEVADDFRAAIEKRGGRIIFDGSGA